MRPSLSLRSILVVALLLTVGFAGASTCATATKPPSPLLVPLDEAVRRTIASGSVRLNGEIRSDAGAVTLTGITSLRDPRSSIVADAPGSPPVEVRVTSTGTWLRRGPEGPWRLIEPTAVALLAATHEWADLLARLRSAGPPQPREIRATHDGAPARVGLDRRGRIRRLRIEKPTGTLDLRLSDHGVAVEVDDP